jgi:hypothetical protein
MNPILFKWFGSVCAAALLLTACSNKTEQFESEQITDYTNLAPGKYITYRIDSTVFVDLGRTQEIHSYQQKHEVDALITDNLGRPSYRVFRYIRDSAGLQPWQANGSYYITPLQDQVETIEDNLRTIRLHMPFNEGFSWKGNRYLPIDNSYFPAYNFSNDEGMGNWDFYYHEFSSSFSHRNQVYNDVWAVEIIEEAGNIPVTDPNSYGARNRAIDRYAKNIGLVYRQFDMWEYQPPAQSATGYYVGFGITMWMIDHN